MDRSNPSEGASGEHIVTAGRYDPAVSHRDHLVGVAQGGALMRDDKNGHAAVQHRQRVEDGGLVPGVERAGRLVKHERRWLAEQRPSQGDALTLSTGEPLSPVADNGIETIG